MTKLDLRFLSRVKRNPKTGCWIWQGKPHCDNYGCGYGRFWIKKEKYYAHRLSYTLFKGDIPEGLVVRHSCNTAMCVNPGHLYTGTVEENNRDKIGMRYYKYTVPKKLTLTKVSN